MRIAKAVKDRKYCSDFCRIVETKYLQSDITSLISEIVIGYWKLEGETITKESMDASLQATEKDPVKLKNLIDFSGQLFALTSWKDAEYALNETKKFITRQELKITTNIFINELEKDNIEAAKLTMRKGLRRVEFDENYNLEDHLTNWEKRQNERERTSKSPEKLLRLGLKKIDSKLGGGVKRAEFSSILAVTNEGKSTFLTHVGFVSMLQGFNTLHVTLENTKEQVNQRYDTRITGIDYRFLASKGYTPAEREIANKKFNFLLNKNGNKLKVVESLDNYFSSETLEKIMDNLELDENWKTDTLILDYADLMRPSVSYKEYRFSVAQIYKDIKMLLKKRNIYGWNAMQARRESKGKVAQSEDAAESYEKSRILDNVFSLSSSKTQKESGVKTFHCSKRRDEITDWEVDLEYAGNLMLFKEI